MADGRIIIDTSVDSSGAERDLSGLTGKMGGMATGALGTIAKVTAGMVTVATGAVAALTKVSVAQYAEYEQLVGGVETLFKDSSSQVMEYANNAFMTAGLSANEYMSTITGFSASLLQGLGGDTKKAAEIGNKAVTDMSDNSNKMGTAMESIQNAYGGFAKANFTMLDNLKLGYGGTKEEMQRLLVDAGKLSGMEYSIGNFSDIIEAIHVIQTEIGITGTTALEAEETISGSFNMLKSAWTNVLTGMADDNANFDTLIGNLVDSIGTFGDNIIPRIKVALNGIGKLVEGLISKLPSIIQEVLPDIIQSGIGILGTLGNSITSSLPMLVSSAVEIIKTLVSGIKGSLPSIVSAAMEILNSLVDGIVEILPMLLELGLQMLITLGQGIAESLPTLIPVIVDLIISMCDIIIENLPLILDVAIDIILALIQGLVTALPTLIQEVPRIINSFADAIYKALPQILKAGIDILLMLIKGLIDSIPTLVANIPQIIMAIVNVFTLMNWASIGKNLITNIGQGISSMVSNIGSIAKNIATSVVEGIKGIFTSGGSIGGNFISFVVNGFSSMVNGAVSGIRGIGTSVIDTIKGVFNMSASDIGSNLIKGIWNGISNMTGWIINLIGGFASSVVGSIKDFFKIKSPSRLMRDLIGTNIVKGIGVGIDVETPNLEKDIDANMSDLVAKMQSTVDYETAMTTARVVSSNNKNTPQTITNTNNNGVTQNVTIVNPERTPSENARALKKVGRDLAFGY